MCKVSIVVPSKNMERYIWKCLESLVSQTLREIEIICVDAFSTDGTRDVIQEYQKRDSRILLLDDDAGSSGYADNLGFAAAKGEYLAIVESDDYVREDMMETLYAKAKDNDLDYIKADFSMFIELDGQVMTLDQIQSLKKLGIYGKVISPSDYPELLELDGYMWKGIYKKTFITENQIKLNETKGAAYQDNGFLHQTICQAKRAMYIEESFYQYRRDNENSSDYNPNGFKMMLEEYRFIDRFMKDNDSKVKAFYGYYYYKMFNQFRGQIEKAARLGKLTQELKEVICEYKDLMNEGVEKGFLRQDEFSYKLEDIHMLNEDVDFYFEYLKRSLKARDKCYSDFINDIKTKEKVVLVCCGEKGRNLYCLLRKNGCDNVVAVCDNQKDKWGTRFFDLIICSVEDACAKYRDSFFVIANDAFHDQIKRQVLCLGIRAENAGIFNLRIYPRLSTSQIENNEGKKN